MLRGDVLCFAGVALEVVELDRARSSVEEAPLKAAHLGYPARGRTKFHAPAPTTHPRTVVGHALAELGRNMLGSFRVPIKKGLLQDRSVESHDDGIALGLREQEHALPREIAPQENLAPDSPYEVGPFGILSLKKRSGVLTTDQVQRLVDRQYEEEDARIIFVSTGNA